MCQQSSNTATNTTNPSPVATQATPPPPTTTTTPGANRNIDATDSPPSSSSLSWFRKMELTINTTLCVPMYTMAIYTTLYSLAFYYTPTIVEKAMSVLTNSNSGSSARLMDMGASHSHSPNNNNNNNNHVNDYVWMIRTCMLLYFPLYCAFDTTPATPPPPYDPVDAARRRRDEDEKKQPWYYWVFWKGQMPYHWIQACRNLWLYKDVAEYFPIQLHKTVDLPVPGTVMTTKSPNPAPPVLSDQEDNNRNSNKTNGQVNDDDVVATSTSGDKTNPPYIFLYHPHGVISMGMTTALTGNACGFDELFPGVRRFGVTLNLVLQIPLLREWILALGYISANKATLVRTLQGNNSIVLVPGGAAEALHSHRTNFRLYLKSRKGFVKLAMETGALLVPCLGFGENEAFETYYPTCDECCPIECTKPTCFLYWQQRICKLLSFSTPILTKLLPNQNPIHVVVGAPVRFETPKSPSSTQQLTLDKCHEQYVQAVRDLFEQHKHQYGYGDMDIEFV